MGTGKTTLGRAVAATLGDGQCVFVDLDHEVERRAGTTVRRIFETRGEEYFRALESLCLDELSRQACEDASGRLWIVACGGGTPCHGDNMARMNSMGLTVHLRTGRGRLINRLILGRAQRPLLRGLGTPQEFDAFIARNLEARAGAYGLASTEFDTDALENESEIRDTVARFLSMMGMN